MSRLVAVILTRNEAHHISDCIAALRGWCDSVVVWDSGSTDATQQLAYLAGAQVVERPFDNYAAQRQAALDTVNAEWILFVDADERVTPALREEILAVVELDKPGMDGYWIPRRNFIAGAETRHGGFFPDFQLRLLRRTHVHYDPGRPVHEIVEVEGETERLQQPLVHYNYSSWEQFHTKQPGYALHEARILRARGVRPLPHKFVREPLREFWRRYITLRGFRDGWHGLKLALLLGWYYGFVPYWYMLTGKT